MATFSYKNERLDAIEQDLNSGRKVIANDAGEVVSIDPSELQASLAGGWQEITPEDVADFRKSQEIRMPDWTATGETEKLDSMRAALEQGQRIMSNEAGEIYSVDEAEAAEAARGGWKVWSPNEINSYIQKQAYGEGAGDVALAAGAGVARGLTMGMSDVTTAKPAEFALGTLLGAPLLGLPGLLLAPALIEKGEQALKERGIDIVPESYQNYKENMTAQLTGLQEQNKAASISGEIVGGLLPAIFTGGASAEATAAMEAKTAISAANAGSKVLKFGKLLQATPAGMLNKVGAAAERAVLGEAITAGTARKIAASMARGATEGGIYGASLETSRIALEDDPLATDAMLPNIQRIAMSSLLGAGGGAVVGGGIKGLAETGAWLSPKVRDIYTRYAASRTNADKGDIDRLFNEFVDDEPLAFAMFKHPEKSIDDIMKEGLDRKYKYSTDITKQDISDFSKMFAELVDQAEKEAKVIYDDLYVTLKDRAVDPLFGRVDQKVLTGSYESIYNSAKEIMKQIDDRPARFMYGQGKTSLQNIIAKMKKEYTRLGMEAGATNQQEFARRIFNILNGAKQDLDNVTKFDMNVPVAARPTIDLLKKLRAKIKDTLYDRNVFGDFADEFAETNGLYSELLYTTRNLQKAFGRKTTTRTGAVEYVTDASKLAKFLKNTETDKIGYGRETINEAIESMGKWVPGSSYANIKQGGLKALESFQPTGNPQGAIAKLKALEPVLDAISKRSVLQNKSFLSGAITPLDVAFGMGGFMFGGPGASIAGVLAARMGKSPIFEAGVVNAIRRRSAGLSNLIERVGRRATITGIDHVKDFFEKKKIDDSKVIELIKKINNAKNTNPKTAQGIIDTATSPFVMTMPKKFGELQAAAARTIGFLMTKTPDLTNIDDWMIEHDGRINSTELSKFKRYYAYINNPELILKEIHERRLSTEAEEVLKVIYPAIYDKLQEVVSEAMHSGELTYQEKIMFMRIFGITPQNTMDIQMVFAPQQEPQAPRTGRTKSGKLRRGTMTDMIERHSSAASKTYV